MMNKVLLLFVCTTFLFCGCTTTSLQKASSSYKKNRDYESFKRISAHLSKGMRRAAVEHLMGEPDYSPAEGQYYYSSDHEVYLEDSSISPLKVPVGVVIDYRDANTDYTLTEELQDFWMGQIGE